MAKSNKPIVWGPFAAGGTLTAFLTPVLVLLTYLAGVGLAPQALAYERVHAFAAHWIGKLVLIVFIALALWSAVHRLRITAYDCGIRADRLVAGIVYLTAVLGTLAAALSLARI